MDYLRPLVKEANYTNKNKAKPEKSSNVVIRNLGGHIDKAHPQTATQDVTLPGVSDLKHNFNIPNYSISDNKPKFIITFKEDVDVDENYD